jgi:peptidoglycan/xylan/chitin deacetylase (PgdA/CDA1 family)
MDWDDLKYLVHFCDIANHTHTHPHLIDGMNECQIRWQIRRANKILEDQLSVEIFYKPRYFIPPYDQLTESIKIIAEEERLRVIEGRIVILNTTK